MHTLRDLSHNLQLFQTFDTYYAGYWHNVIYLESLGTEADNRRSQISVIEPRISGYFKKCFYKEVVETVRYLDFQFVDIYRIIYADAYTDAYSVERARRLTRDGN